MSSHYVSMLENTFAKFVQMIGVQCLLLARQQCL